VAPPSGKFLLSSDWTRDRKWWSAGEVAWLVEPGIATF